MKTNVHQNSLDAYREGRAHLSKRAHLILDFLRGTEHPVTDRQVQHSLKFDERGQVQPRISELVAFGLVEEVDKIKCTVTGKSVRRVRAVQIKRQGELFQ